VAQFKATSSPLMHILSLYRSFFTKFTEEKNQLEKKIETTLEEIKEIEENKTADNKDASAEKQEGQNQEEQDKKKES